MPNEYRVSDGAVYNSRRVDLADETDGRYVPVFATRHSCDREDAAVDDGTVSRYPNMLSSVISA